MNPNFKAPKRCRNCGDPLPADAHFNARYCNDACRKKFARTVNGAKAAGIDAVPGPKERSQAVTPAVKAARALAFEGMEDEIRETLRAEVRDQVRQHLKDNILGGVEALTALLPEVLTRLGEDVEHPDWMRSSRAQALILKYVFQFKDTDAADGDSKTINIFHGVPVPDSPLGERMKESVLRREQEVVDGEYQVIPAQLIDPSLPDDEVVELPREAFEQFYPQCDDCGDIKPPDTFAMIHQHDNMRGLCRSCEYQRQIKKDLTDRHNVPESILPEGPTSRFDQDL